MATRTSTITPHVVHKVVPTSSAATAQGDQSAKRLLTDTLNFYGLGTLTDWAWQKSLNGESFDQIMLELKQTPEYAQRFPAMKDLIASGHAISETDYVNLESAYSDKLHQYGIPKGLWDTPLSFSKWISGNVSPSELEGRLQAAQAVAVESAPAEVRQKFNAFYGVGDGTGALTAYWLNPNESLPVIQQQVASAQIAAAASMTGFGDVGRTTAENLAKLGVTQSAAQSGFSSLAGLGEVRQTLHGEKELTSDQLIAAAFAGDAHAQSLIKQRQASRVAAFQGSSNYSQSQGHTGIGSAQGA